MNISTMSNRQCAPVPRRAARRTALLALLAAALFVVGCARKPPAIEPGCEAPLTSTTFSFDQGTYPSELDLFSKYRIAPGDILDVIFQIRRQKVDRFPITLYHTIRVQFVDMPQLSETQEVLPNGTIILPYVGEVKVLGKTPKELQEELTERYSDQLRDPQLYVTVQNFNARIDQLREDLMTAPRGLSKLVTVRPDGYAMFPLIGEMLVARETLTRVNEMIQKRYEDYLPGLKADLFLHEQSGSVIYVLGQVREPGAYEIKKPVTALQSVALAGGYTPQAELRSVIVFRQHEERRIARSLNLKDVTGVKRDSAFFYLRPDDIVYLPETRISTLAQLMRDIADITMFEGWSYGIGDQVDWVGPNN